jgi:hypothetical protein
MCPLKRRPFAGFAALLVRFHHVPKFSAFRDPGASLVILTTELTHIIESVLVSDLSLTCQPLVFRTVHCSHRIALATNESANCHDIIRLGNLSSGHIFGISGFFLAIDRAEPRSAPRGRKSGVREMAKMCELSELSRLSRRIRRFFLPSALADRDRWRTIGRCGDRGRSGNEK